MSRPAAQPSLLTPVQDRPTLMVVCDGTNIAPDGRVRHYFTKRDGRWLCTCGELRDGSGK